MQIDQADEKDFNQHIYTLIDRPGPYKNEGFQTAAETKEFLHSCKVLVIGAGGLGCELLKDLALSGFKEIHCIDMDTIDISNLNRQFLFRDKDVGKSKAIVAAEFIMQRVPGCKVVPHFDKIQNKDMEYYSQFDVIICGLDSVEARRWMNATIIGMFDEDDPDSFKPIIDGGTEGFKGQSRIILPKQSACYECSLEMQTKPKTFPMCTIANTPRLPEHCIEFASQVLWPKNFPDTKLDGDNPEHIKWLLKTAQDRGKEFQIEGITYTLTQGVVKNIIPAVASTNAIIAASCVNEAFKMATNTAKLMDNYMMYVGDQGIYTFTFPLERKTECSVCGSSTVKLECSGSKTLEELIEMLIQLPAVRLRKPSLRTSSVSLYMRAPVFLEKATRANLSKTMNELLGKGIHEVVVTDQDLPINIMLQLKID